VTGWCINCGLRIVQTSDPEGCRVWVHVRNRQMHCPSATVATPLEAVLSRETPGEA
jgi:hypothetical protein